ncbi:MAG: asparagine synthase (glutamine-hydrolyzing) [Lachnospiraceae bacterium]|nr:asparagine synthase (glutamine-hydrolyzing) [Lachnospiraceae bacterium]
MCGICGFTGHNLNSEEVLTRMMNRIIHRGPDGASSYITEQIAFGHRRLSIIDLSDKGTQPMFNEDKTLVCVFNGEIYNYKELREELIGLGHEFNSSCDTEVLLHGYESWGASLLDRLRGMFAFVLYNEKTGELFMARDMFGIKPLYYMEIDHNLVFASEIKSLLEYPAYQREVNLEALEQYLSFEYSVLPETFFKGIYKLMPGHYMTWKEGESHLVRYFDPMLTPAKEPMDHDRLLDEIDRTLQDSIHYHMVADVEVASLLSSGVDSSYVACHFGGGRTYTVGFDYEKYNEIPYAKDLSDTLGIKNTGKVISTEEYWEELPRIQYYMDEPLADASAAALYFVDREAAKDVKVILSGEGSDEFFGGYNIYHEPMSLAGYQKIPAPLRKGMAALASLLPRGVKGRSFLIRGSKKVEDRFIGNANVYDMKLRNKVLKNTRPGFTPQSLTKPFYDKVKGLKDTEKMQYIDLNFWLIGDILLKADKMSMAQSIESRVPFLDRKVFELARTLRLEDKVNDSNTKLAFRQVANRYLSEQQAKKKKLGFPVPIRVWLRDDKFYKIVKEAFTSEDAEQFFHTEELVKILDAHKAGKYDYAKHIWIVYMFLLWYRQYFHEGGESVTMEDELEFERIRKNNRNARMNA